MQTVLADYTPKPVPFRDANAPVIDMNFNMLNNTVKLNTVRLAKLAADIRLVDKTYATIDTSLDYFWTGTHQFTQPVLFGDEVLTTTPNIYGISSNVDGFSELHITSPGETTPYGLVYINEFVLIDGTPDDSQSVVNMDSDLYVTWNTYLSGVLDVVGAVQSDTLIGTGTRLVTSTSGGTLGNATTIAGSYTFSSTITGAITGNAGTATALQTARTINTVSFDGTANIVVTAAAGTLTGTTLNSTVVTSSLTSVGTLTSLAVSGTSTLTGNVNINAATNTANHRLNVKDGYISSSGTFGFYAFGVGAPTDLAAGNSEYVTINHDGSTRGAIAVGKTGTGTYRPLNFYTSNTLYMSLNITGGLALGANAVSGLASNDKILSVSGAASTTQEVIRLQTGQSTGSNGSYMFILARHRNTGGGNIDGGTIRFTSVDQSTGVRTAKVGIYGSNNEVQTLGVEVSPTGLVGIGTSPATGSQLQIRSAILATTTSYGIDCAPTFQIGVTTGNTGYFEVRTVASGSMTLQTGTAIKIGSPTVGAGSEIQNLYGIDVADMTAGTATNVALRTGLGQVVLGGAIQCNSTLETTGGFSPGSFTSKTGSGYETGVFTVTLTGVTTTVTGTARWVRIGSAVILYLPNLTGTSNSTACTITGLPASIQPVRTWQIGVCEVEDNSQFFLGSLQLTSGSGTMTLYKISSLTGGNSSVFTNGNTKGLTAQAPICYHLL